jgi:hypothetical protein
MGGLGAYNLKMMMHKQYKNAHHTLSLTVFCFESLEAWSAAARQQPVNPLLFGSVALQQGTMHKQGTAAVAIDLSHKSHSRNVYSC